MNDVLAHLSRDIKCVNEHLPLGQGKLGERTGRTLSLLAIPPRIHHPGKGGMADLLLQNGGPVVKMCQCSVITVKGSFR